MKRGPAVFADLDSALQENHGDISEVEKTRSPFDGMSELGEDSGSHLWPAHSDINGNSLPPVNSKYDIETERANAHDPSTRDWIEDPVTFRVFCESDDHMALLNREAKDLGEGALSERQYEDCLKILGDDPKHMFDPEKREYTFGALLWAKGCLDGDTELFDEITKKRYKVKELVHNKIDIHIRVYDEKNSKILIKPVKEIFSKGSSSKRRFDLASGKTFVVGSGHRLLTDRGWLVASDIGITSKIAVDDGTTIIYEAVVYVRECYYGEVFDLTIDDETPNYFDAAGILHHNSGKDWVCSIIQCYLVYVLLCMRDPQDFFGFAPGEVCDIVNVGKKGKQAEQVYFSKFRARVLNWQWMKNKYNILDEGKVFHKRGRQFPTCKIGAVKAEWSDKLVRAISEASKNPEGFEGYNIVFYLCDEISGWVSPAERAVANEIIRVLRTSQASRNTKHLCGLGMAISYPRQDDDIMFEFEEESKKPGSKTYFSRGYQWDIKPQRLYCGRKFQFNAGTVENPELWDIPTELDEDYFRKYPEEAKGAYLLNPPAVGEAYFEYVDKIDSIVNIDRQPLFKVETDYIPSQDGHGNTIYYVRKTIVGLNRQPDPNADYVVWLDAAESNCDAALTFGHPEYITLEEAGEKKEVTAVIADQTVVWEPDKKLRRIVDIESMTQMCLTSMKYISLGAVWWDQWNSGTGIFDLRNAGILCDKHNLSGGDYQHFKSTVYTSRFLAPDGPESYKGVDQVKHLSRTRTGNVTPGSAKHKKDIADTWCGITVLLTGSLVNKGFRHGRAPGSIRIVGSKPGVTGSGSKTVQASGYSHMLQGLTQTPASVKNPFSGGMNQAAKGVITNHSDFLGGLDYGMRPSIKGKSTPRAKPARPSAPGQHRFPRGITA